MSEKKLKLVTVKLPEVGFYLYDVEASKEDILAMSNLLSEELDELKESLECGQQRVTAKDITVTDVTLTDFSNLKFGYSLDSYPVSLDNECNEGTLGEILQRKTNISFESDEAIVVNGVRYIKEAKTKPTPRGTKKAAKK